ncbi:hypothetical protein LS482_17180 [Sinomicrobium kalidii]|uniref:MauE/DoxX family redox-associated membrane protein n=1 Tax=Sinomicrobium kalidii TaxID=2900738 RepID=UPI001E447B7B|nr:MauE/DoxX family redox-associated membrane protein [Sinomicrobium kalidii]UGU15402.1 hypothetical protein LS482_17180 [Sinomicrobium kalidii]
MKWYKKHSRIAVRLIFRWFIILFTYAALSKLLDYQQFRIQLGQSPMFTTWAAEIAWFVPSLEVLIAVMLAIPRFRLLALYLTFSLMVMFSSYIYAILHFSSYVPCSCGGILEKMGWTEHLIFNIVMVLLAIIAIRSYPSTNGKQEKPKEFVAL